MAGRVVVVRKTCAISPDLLMFASARKVEQSHSLHTCRAPQSLLHALSRSVGVLSFCLAGGVAAEPAISRDNYSSKLASRLSLDHGALCDGALTHEIHVG